MTKEAVEFPLNLEKIEPKFGLRRTRSSTSSLSVETGKTKALPHYLLPSFGSCHDICKYGAKRDAETTDLQKKKRSAGTTRPPLDSTIRTANQFTRKEVSSSSKKVVSAPNPTQSKPRPLKIKESSSSTAQPPLRRRYSDIIIPKRSGDFEMNPISLSRRNSDTKLVSDRGSAKVSKKKVVTPPAESPSIRSLSKKVLRDQKSLTKAKSKQVNDHQSVSEKTPCIIEPEGESQATSAVQGTLSLEKRDFQGRCEKIDVQCEKTSPRTLRFTQGDILPENEDMNFAAREISLRRVEANGKLNDEAGDDNIKVDLRHEDVEEKKNPQNLLNNVIEETVSKLVKARKSRVKALVGAFETVISLWR